jgi:uncharacterized protein YggE
VIRRLVTTVVAASALATPALVPDAASAQRTISVAGDASMSVPNDAARFVLGVEVSRRTPGAALRTSSARMRRVTARLRASGIPAADIETLVVDLDRVVRRRRGGRRRLVRFVATNRVRVTVREVRRAGETVDAAVRSGATSVRGPDFFRSDARALYRQALLMAFDDARAKADALARRAGGTIGRPLSIRESGFEESVAERGLERAAAPGRRAPPVEPGTTEVDAQVFVVFEMT